jgi:prephenate dehydrogenase
LCIPLGEMRETLKRIGPDLKPDAVVLDTAPAKSLVLEWAREFIPEGRFYLGLVPSVTASAISSSETGLNAARPDLFKRTVIVVDVPPGTPAEVEQLAFNFAALLGAKPMLADIVESDGIMSIVHLLPQLAAVAFLNATVDLSGWAEARKLAGPAFLGATNGIAFYDDPDSLKSAALGSRSGTLHALDNLISALEDLREDIEHADEQGLAKHLGRAFDARERWLNERSAAEWLREGGDPVELPELGEQIMQSFFGSRITDRKKRK